MGRTLRYKSSCSPIQKHPGFMWGLFNILKQNHWRHIKKKFPHKRIVTRRHAGGTRNEGNNVKTSNDCDSTEDDSYVDYGKRSMNPNPLEKPKRSDPREKLKKPNSEEKSKKHRLEEKSKKHNQSENSKKTNSEIKNSVKALIKALALDDKSKRNSRHQRSSTYPARSSSVQNESLNQLKTSDKNSSNEDHRRVFEQTGGISPAIGSLNPLYLMSEESSSSDSDGCKVDKIHIDDNGNGLDMNKTDSEKEKRDTKSWYDSELMHREEVTENDDDDDDTSPRQSKACLDALNLIHMNRNFLVKVLQDPGSPLARHFNNQQACATKSVFSKAGSSSGKRDYEPKDHNLNINDSSSLGSDKNETMEKITEEGSSGSGYARKRGKNQVVVKRFKDLRQKIRHVIKEHKSERQRITMDAVLDKVPRKHGFSKDLRQEILCQLKGQSVNRNIREGSKLKQIRRTSSMGVGSLDRYVQLYESSFQREAKNQISEKSQPEAVESMLGHRRAPKTLGRILSLPEMKCYSFKMEDFPENKIDQFITSERSDEQEQEDMTKKDEMKINDEIMLDLVQGTESATRSSDESSKDRPFLENAQTFSISQEEEEEEAESSESIEEEVEVEAQDKAKFNYVRDILEVSGFGSKESLSTWHSDYQPLDPSVYNEVTAGCMFQDPECSGNEEGGNCNHWVLFDLINEVLIEIYERSYHYSPVPLSPLCKIHQMRGGYSVLKDVWIRISSYLGSKVLDDGQSLDDLTNWELSKPDEWMNLQFDSECVGLEVEEIIFDDLLEEVLEFDGLSAVIGNFML